MTFENIDIKTMIKEKGYSQREIAKKIGITDVHFSRVLNRKLTDDERLVIINAINGGSQKWKKWGKALPPTESDLNSIYEQGRIQGRVEMRTELLIILKEFVGDEAWSQI